MKKYATILILLACLSLQGCAYDLGYALGSATRYAGVGAAAAAL